MQKGKLFLILGPSGSGKGATIEYLRKAFPQAFFPTSCTTRPPRPGELDGGVYHYVTKKEFEEKIAAGEFLEYAVVHHDHYYGTLKQPILEALEEGKIVIREVDMQGVQSIKKVLPLEQLCSVFITTASWDILKRRILQRHQETGEELEKRRQSFEKEMVFSKNCDYIVESREGELEQCQREVESIIKKEFGA